MRDDSKWRAAPAMGVVKDGRQINEKAHGN